MYVQQKQRVPSGAKQKPPVRPSSPKKKQTVIQPPPLIQRGVKQPPPSIQRAKKNTFFNQPVADILPPSVFTTAPQEPSVFTTPPAYVSLEKSYPMTLEIIPTREPMLDVYSTTPSPFIL